MPGSRHQRRRGLSITEMALCLPILLLIGLGTIEACSMIYLKQSLEIAAYEGVRVALNPAAETLNVEGQCVQILSDRRVADATINITPSDIETANVGEFIRVSVDAPCDSNSLFGVLFYGGKTLTGSVEMMKEF